ncbi:MAG: NUDIX hydrolase, partial [Actinomycetes bacterium]
MDPTRALPAHLVEHAKAYADGSRTPVEPRNASTVVLMRAGESKEPGSLEVYLLRRHVDMAFAAGMCVFPGGGVDPRDFDSEIAWVGPPPSAWAERFGADESVARALVCAAVRETFEESGVLFAGPTENTVVEDTTGDDWEEDRRRLEARELSFTDFLQQRGLK